MWGHRDTPQFQPTWKPTETSIQDAEQKPAPGTWEQQKDATSCGSPRLLQLEESPHRNEDPAQK